MSRRKRVALLAAGSLAGLLIVLGLTAVLVLRSDWFFEKVRARIVSTVETATGGRVEIGAFRFDWSRLRAEVTDFVLRGTEPAGKPPLFRAARLVVGLEIISLARRDVDIDYLEVERPQAYLMISPEGRTNVPEPKIKRQRDRSAVETILNLAIGRFDLRDGSVEVESRWKAPLDASGRNLRARFLYETAGPRYRGEIAMNPVNVRYGDRTAVPLEVDLEVALERDRVQLSDGRIRTGSSVLSVQGSLENLASPRASAQYELRADLADVGRILDRRSKQSGIVTVGGNASWSGGSNFHATGNVHAFNVDYRDSSVTVRDVKADSALEIRPGVVELGGLRATGVYVDRTGALPVSAQVRSIVLEGDDVNAAGVAVAALGGSFQGEASLRDLERYRAEGRLSGFEIRRLVATYSKEALPWDGRLSGPVAIEGSLKRKDSLRATAKIAISPAESGAPVHGQVGVRYDARRNVLEVDRSFVALPNSRLDVSGAIGRELTFHVETRDLRDILPAVGAAGVPVKIESGAIIFDGVARGKANAPEIDGRLSTGRVSYAGTTFDSVQANVKAAETGIAFENLRATRGTLHAQGRGSLALNDWKPQPSSPVSADIAVRDAGIADLLAMAKLKDIEATGTLNATAHVDGTYAKPAASGEIVAVKGSIQDEPFDRITAKVNYTEGRIHLADAVLTAGPKQVAVEAEYEHPPRVYDHGRLTFRVSSNAMPLDQFRTLEKARPGIRGNVVLTANGQVEVLPERAGQERFRIVDLQADVRGRELQLTGQPLGDARLVANTEGDQLRVRVASDFANSRIRGEGQWRLAGDYPGKATVTFTRLDFRQLGDWISPRTSARQIRLAGAAEGELVVEGPARRPELMTGTLRIPKLEIGPAAGTTPNGVRMMLRNQGPIVVSLSNQVITVADARFVGRSTDLKVGGKILLQQQKSPLDLKVDGRIDLGLLEEFNRDVFSSGIVQAEASVRGPFNAPLVNGRMELKNAAFGMTDLPNGISQASGVILFTGDRATIQSLKGESGGGDIELSGFAGYGAGELIFRLHATAESVRVRYPEGVSTVADAELDFTGTTARSMLSGTVTVQRTGFNPQSDLSSILAKSAEPVRTPSAGVGFLGGLNFDIQIETSPDITFQSSLAEGIHVESNLRLRGTASNPALLGRINITQGQIVFFGTKYTINQGSIGFYNPVKIEPVLNIDLETKARGVDVTFTVSGPMNKLTLTPRSDPPLQFSEIVALLATGRAPTSDPSLLAQQTTSPQNWQQMGASTLLGQAVANPVAGRLQRFFGVSKLKIDPTLTGVENNPQARLTLEQQVTSNITFTYITNVTSSNPQVVRVEWAFSRQWSVVALREENGRFGMDFLYKRRFR